MRLVKKRVDGGPDSTHAIAFTMCDNAMIACNWGLCKSGADAKHLKLSAYSSAQRS